jgi:phosphate acetyltransferase
MSRTLLVVPTAAGASLARTCLGLVRALDRRGVNVAFVKPVAQPRADGGPDRSIALATATTALRPPDPLSTAHLEQHLGSGGLDAVLEKIVAAWQPVHDRSDVVVVEGLSPGPAKLYAGGLNQALAKAVDADVLLVASWPAAGAVSGEDRAAGAAEPVPDPAGDAVKLLAESLAITASGYWSGEHTRVVGCVVNGTPAGDPPAAAQLREVLAQGGLRLIAAVPHRPELTWLRVRDLVRELGPRVLSEGDLSRRIKDVAVFAQGVPGGLRVLTEGRLVVVPGDRHDVVMAACLAALSGTRPRCS